MIEYQVKERLYPGEDAEMFAVWAFGEEHGTFQTPIQFLNAWNSKHREELHVLALMDMGVSIDRMIQVWRDR